MSTTLLASNPWSDDFSDLVAPWMASTPGAGGSSVSAVSNRLRLYIPSGGDFRWMSAVNKAPRAILPLFTAGALASMNDFVVQFKVVAATIEGADLDPAAGGIALLKAADPATFTPIIEVGGTSAGSVIYHSWDGQEMGGVYDAAAPTLPFWIRLVRTDSVVYALVSASVSGPWTSIATTAAAGCMARETADASPSVYFDAIALYARGSAAGGSGLTLDVQDFSVACWPYKAKPVSVGDLRARTELDGEAIRLSWTNPQGEDVPRYVSIWRSRYGHPEYKRAPYVGTPPEGLGFGALGEEIYSGAPIETLLDENLNPDRFYYYTIFATRAPVPPTFTDVTVAKYAAHPCDTDWGPQAVATNKVTGWSQRDIVAEEPLATYMRFPETVRELDQADAKATGSSTGYLERFANFLQHAEAHHRGLVQGFGYINDPAQAPLGLVGKAADQTSVVDAFLTALNLSGLARLDGITKRRLWEGLLAAYKRKGSVPGVRDFVTLLTGWRGHSLEESGLGTTLRGLKTWDGSTTREEFTIAGGLTFSAGSVGGFTGLTPSKYKGGVFVDYFGNKKFILDNTDTTLTLADTAWVGYNEITFTGTVVTGGGGTAVQLSSGWPFAKSAGDCSYDGAELAGTKTGAFVHTPVTASTYAIGASWLSVGLNAFDDGGSQSFALGYAFTGATYAGRVPTARCWLYTGEPSWLYNPKSDLSLVGTVNDPYYRLWAGTDVTGIGAKLPTGVTDLIIWAPTGAAKYASLVTTSFVDTTVHQVCIQDGPARPNVQVGDWINPNRAQGQWFRISQIDDSTSLRKYRVDPSPDGLVPSDVALAGDLATIAVRTTMENDGILRFFLPVILPYDVTLFVFYT